jgi:hypothetical protein
VDFLDKLRKKTDREKKIIIWTVLIIFGLIFLLLWGYNSQRSIRSFKAENIMEEVNIPPQESIPKMEGPNDEDIKALEELMNQIEQENAQ